MFRFLHLADVHFETKFLARSKALRDLLRDSQRLAFRRAVDYAISQKVHAILIAGDLFDNGTLSFSTENFLVEQLSRLREARIPSVYVTGNHDPGTNNLRFHQIDWPEGFHILNQPEPHSLPIQNAQGAVVGQVVGAGHDAQHIDENLVVHFPSENTGVPRVGLIHTLVTSAQAANQHDRYAPCSAEDLQRRGYAYWALGHIHHRQRVPGAVEAWYSGVLQGRNFLESGPKGGLLVTIPSSGSPEVYFKSFASARFETVRLNDLTDLFSVDQLRERLSTKLQKRWSEVSREECQWLFRLELSGPCPLAELLRDENELSSLEEDLADNLDVPHLEISARSVYHPVDLEQFRGTAHVLSEVIGLIEAARDDPELLERLCPEQLAGAAKSTPESLVYLRDLLTDLENEAVYRFLAPPNVH